MRIPLYQEQEQTRPAGIPSPPRQVPGASGEAVAQGLAGAERGLLELADVQKQLKHEADVTQSQENENILHNEGLDQYEELKRKHGDQAMEYAATMRENLAKRRDELLKNNTYNPVQQRIFKSNSDSLLTQFHGLVENHVTQEIERRKALAHQGTLDTANRKVGASPNSDEEFENALTIGRAAIRERTKTQVGPTGKGDKEAETVYRAEQDAFEARLVETRLSNLAANHDAKGITDFWAKPGVRAVLGDRSAHYAAMVDETVRQERSYTTAQEILNNKKNKLQSANPNVRLVNETKALDDVDDPKRVMPAVERERVRQLVQQGISQRKEGQNQLNGVQFNKAVQSVIQSGGDLNTVDPGVRAYLEDPTNGGDMLWVRVDHIAKSLRYEGFNSPPTPSQVANFGRLQADMAENWGEWARRDSSDIYTTYAGKGDAGLTLRQLQEAYALHAQTKREAQGSMGQGVGPVAAAEIMRQMRDKGTLPRTDPKFWNDEQGSSFNYVASEILKREIAHRTATKKPPMYTDYEEWVKQELKHGAIPGQGRLSNRYFTTDREMSKVNYMRDPEQQKRGPWISDEELDVINTQLKKEKKEVTPENQIRVYNITHGVR